MTGLRLGKASRSPLRPAFGDREIDNKQSTSTFRRAEKIVRTCARITQFMKKILGKGDQISAQKPDF